MEARSGLWKVESVSQIYVYDFIKEHKELFELTNKIIILRAVQCTSSKKSTVINFALIFKFLSFRGLIIFD